MVKTSELVNIRGVRGYMKDDVPQLNTEDIARGLGFTENKNGIEYVMWRRVGKYLEEFNFGTCAENGKCPEYIPENIFYKLCFKAKNETAKKFQDQVTDVILPEIRKHGMYITPSTAEQLLSNPDFIIMTMKRLKDEMTQRKALQQQVNQQDQLIGELKPKVDYLDRILKSKSTVTINAIANDYGMTAQAMNKKLHELGIQYKQGTQWLLYSKYRKNGYVHNKAVEFYHSNGELDTKYNMEWTQKGRIFLYDILKENEILPLIEQE